MTESPPPKPQAPPSVRADNTVWVPIDTAKFWPPSPSVVGLGLVVAFFVISTVVLAGLWILGQFVWQVFMHPPKDFEDISRRLIAIGIIVAAPFAIWRIIISHWQARAAQHQARAAARDADTSREEHYTTLFTTAVQQLGAMREVTDLKGTRTEPNTEARLGAIYALERIAQDSERDHWPIMETLCAYVRKNAGPPRGVDSEVESDLAFYSVFASSIAFETKEAARPFVDVQAALTVIGRRREDRREHENRLRISASGENSYRLDLTRTELSGIILDGLDFDYARFDGSTLAFSQFKKTSVRKALFENVRAAGADFTAARMEHARLSGDWSGVVLRSASLSGANCWFAGFRGAEFSGAKMIGADCRYSNFTGASFQACDRNYSPPAAV